MPAELAQITFLLFLKIDQERAEPLGEPSTIPAAWRCDKLAPLAGDERERSDRHDLPQCGFPAA